MYYAFCAYYISIIVALYAYIYILILMCGKEILMFIKAMAKVINNTYHDITDRQFDKVDPNIIRYFRIEYGKDWKIALENYLYREKIRKSKKAA